jgi:hypothetical protein
VRNDTEEPVRVLVVSTMVFPEVAEHPDSDKVLVLSALPETEGRLLMAFPRAAEVDRLEGELRET